MGRIAGLGCRVPVAEHQVVRSNGAGGLSRCCNRIAASRGGTKKVWCGAIENAMFSQGEGWGFLDDRGEASERCCVPANVLQR